MTRSGMIYEDLVPEEAVKIYSIAYSMDESVSELNEEQVERAVEIFKHYGQGTSAFSSK